MITSTLRVLLCAAVAISLNVHAAAANPSMDGSGGFAQILAGAPQAPGIHANRTNQGLQISKRRCPTHSAFVLPTAAGPAADWGHGGIITQNGERLSFLPAGRAIGRSPPNRIS
jgi:hypothetical protein